MAQFEWLQTCTKEELAEWIDAFREQCEDNVISKVENSGIKMTEIYIAKELRCLSLIKQLDEELKGNAE